MKKLITISVLGLLLSNTATNTAGAYKEPVSINQEITTADTIDAVEVSPRDKSLQKRIKQLYKHIGKTSYVLSGASPAGWDCSGMVMWFYEDLGVTLEHSAAKQKHSGKIVKEPRLGDIIAFSYSDGTSYHTGIYAGNGFFIHAPKPGKLTEITSIDNFVSDKSRVSFIRVNF